MSNYEKEINRRRTFAIISHPDAGKTTLTEKFLLYGGAINLAGSVKGKATARHAVSESAALQAEPARIRYAPSRCWGCRPIRIKRKDDSLVNKFPILSSFLFILTRLVAYPKYLSSTP